MACKLNTKPKGFALVLVLWVLSLMTLMAGSFALGMRREISITDGIKNNAQAVAVAESGIAVAEYMLLAAEQNTVEAKQAENWHTDGSIYQLKYGATFVRVRMIAETGKIDINQADPQLLRALLSHAPVPGLDRKEDPATRVAKLAGAITDWRDPDDTANPEGAEKQEYQNAGLQYRPSNKPFQNIEELQRVLGMDAETFQWLEPLITVYSGQQQVDKNATREVLSLLPGLEPAVIEQFLLARLESTKFGKPLTFPIASKYINAGEADTQQSGAVTIISEAKLADGSRAAVSAVVIKSEIEPVSPFQVLKWQRNHTNEVSLFHPKMNELVVAQYNEPQFND